MADSNAHIGENVAHQAVGAAIKLRGGNHFVALFQGAQQRRGNCSHSAGSDDASFRAFQCRDFLFGHAKSRIAVAGVYVGAALSFGPALHFRAGRKREGGGAANLGDHSGPDAVPARFSSVNGERARTCILTLLGSFSGFHGESILERDLGLASTNMALYCFIGSSASGEHHVRGRIFCACNYRRD